MDKETAARLLALNREFYTAFARPFAASRPMSDPALVCILPHIPQRARVLDVGCGNGRLPLLLDRERPGVIYLGVDVVPELVELASVQANQLTAIAAEFRVADVARPGWGSLLPGAPFDCAVALAILHHIPGFDLRVRVLREIAGLLKPGGRLIISTWQFLGSVRMRRKIVDWAEVGMAGESLEPGDYLLDWKREGRGLRYCHMVDEAEVKRLAAESGFRVRETFRAGGREGNLSLFAVFDRSA
ncbi:MAG: methyltransferase domain-containing protein [Chloroflexota bacterium]|nr:methyltransferase domain-containing protein [Chloroflexota bacterium]